MFGIISRVISYLPLAVPVVLFRTFQRDDVTVDFNSPRLVI